MVGIVYNKFYIWSFWTTFIGYIFCHLFQGFLVYILDGPFFSPRILHRTIWKICYTSFSCELIFRRTNLIPSVQDSIAWLPLQKKFNFQPFEYGPPKFIFVFNMRNMDFKPIQSIFHKRNGPSSPCFQKKKPQIILYIYIRF